jgi:hypothetical protein
MPNNCSTFTYQLHTIMIPLLSNMKSGCALSLMLPLLVVGCMQRAAVNDTPPERPVSSIQSYSYARDVKPILDQKCVACHGCYDAPCQLQLTSADGLLRGATKNPIYDSARLTDMAPTRLFVDATSTVEWREKKFFPVLNEQGGSLDRNLESSLLFKMILLGRDHPLLPNTPVPEDIQLGLQRENECPMPSGFYQYAQKTPLQGMPLAITGLSEIEFTPFPA